jgi:hypothetical protein
VRAGEPGAADALVDRSLPVFAPWASRRIPAWAVGRVDASAVVRSALLDALPRLRDMEPSSAGTVQAMLRDAVYERLSNDLRALLPHGQSNPGESPMTASVLEQAAGRWNLERYDSALAALRPLDREAIIGRLELRQSYEELATALGEVDASVARARVTTAVARLVEKMASLS